MEHQNVDTRLISEISGTCVIIRSKIRHHKSGRISTSTYQSNFHCGGLGPLTITGVYCPPRFDNKEAQYSQLLGNRFLAAGDFMIKVVKTTSASISTRHREIPDRAYKYPHSKFFQRKAKSENNVKLQELQSHIRSKHLSRSC